MDQINKLESKLASEQSRWKALQKQSEENHNSLCFYIEKYIKGDQKASESPDKRESGNEASKSQLVDILELDTEYIQK